MQSGLRTTGCEKCMPQGKVGWVPSVRPLTPSSCLHQPLNQPQGQAAAATAAAKSLQSYLTLSDPMDCSLPGSSVHGIFQARVVE